MRKLTIWIRCAAVTIVLLMQARVAAGAADPVAAAYRAASTFDFGAFCLDGVPAGSVVDVGAPELGPFGDVREVTLRFRTGLPQRPRVFFYANARPRATPFAPCDEAPPGARRILEGRIKDGTLRFRAVEPVAGRGRAVMIQDGGMNIELSQVVASFDSLYGGSVVPGDVRVQVINVGSYESNVGELNQAEDDRLSGKLSVGSYKLRLNGAQLRVLGVDAATVTNFEAAPEGVVFHVAIPSGALSLADGGLRTSSQSALEAGTLRLASAAITVISGVAEQVRLIGKGADNEPTMELHRLELNAPTVDYTIGQGAHLAPTQPITVTMVSGSLETDRSVATLARAAAQGLAMSAGAVRVGGEGAAASLAGTGSVELATLSEEHLEGELRLDAPTFPSLASAIPAAGRQLLIRFRGSPGAPEVEGSFDLSSTRVGSLEFSQLAATRSTFGRGAGEPEIRFLVDARPSAGSWSLLAPDGASIVVAGSATALRLAGKLALPEGGEGPRLVVEPQGLWVEAAGTVVSRSLVFGAPAADTTLGSTVALSSPDGVVIDAQGARGMIHLRTDLLATGGAA